MTEHVTLLNPAELLFCGECGKGNYAESDEVHPTAGRVYKCTWADCEHEGLTVSDVQLEWDEELEFVRTEAGLCLGWRVKLDA